ncbi:MAG: CAP domain-containing protein [SAR324 cluster bacterium]|uniref:CAP domain-containing protein n=1 Tax=SAR324 cluster bacterium TaxID=2024889 RepID=A0A7X9FT90_9DELT|nr:CAP domain-containing protein [SAR324 cluster bacterium]
MIQRRLPGDTAFEYFAEYHGLKSFQVITDEPEDIGTISYRARLITSKGESQWSKSKKIIIDPNTASTRNRTSNSEVIDTSTPAPTALGKGQTLCPKNQATQVIALVNDYRTNAGLEALKVHPQLQWAARAQGIRMASSKTFSNEGWNEYITLSGFEIGTASVNIAKRHRTALAVINSWMSNGNGYRSNILSNAFKYIGAACIVDNTGIFWWVIDFGTPYQCPFLF